MISPLKNSLHFRSWALDFDIISVEDIRFLNHHDYKTDSSPFGNVPISFGMFGSLLSVYVGSTITMHFSPL